MKGLNSTTHLTTLDLSSCNIPGRRVLVVSSHTIHYVVTLGLRRWENRSHLTNQSPIWIYLIMELMVVCSVLEANTTLKILNPEGNKVVDYDVMRLERMVNRPYLTATFA